MLFRSRAKEISLALALSEGDDLADSFGGGLRSCHLYTVSGWHLVDMARRNVSLVVAGVFYLSAHGFQSLLLSIFLRRPGRHALRADRKRVVSGRSVSVRVGLGGRRR